MFVCVLLLMLCTIVDVMCKPHGLSKCAELYMYYRTPKSSLDQMIKIACVSTAKTASMQ